MSSIPQRGLVSGYVWKLIRESASMTQIQLAEDLGVDVATVQGWESGRRPLSAVRIGDLARFRVRLIGRGVKPQLFAVLGDAIEADVVIDHAVHLGEKPGSPRDHPLAATVHRRDLTNLITWPFNGMMPTQLHGLARIVAKRRGPVASQPVLGVDERRRFFDHLLSVAETHQATEEQLLRRQAVYLLSFDGATQTKDWLLTEHTRAIRRAGRLNDAGAWIAVRSSAVALTRHGMKDPLLNFMNSGLSDHEQEVANLSYWAYWLGEVREIHTDDTFMRHLRPASWDGGLLLGHLVNRIAPGAEQLELNVRTLWQLLLARPHLLTEHVELRELVLTSVHETLGCNDLNIRSRQELSDVAYAVRLSSR